MTKNELFDRIVKILKDSFEIEPVRITPEARLYDDLDIDSIDAVDLIVQIGRQRDGVRRIVQVSDVAGLENDVVVMNDIFRLMFEGEDENGKLRTRYVTSPARPSFYDKLKYCGMEQAWQAALAGESA